MCATDNPVVIMAVISLIAWTVVGLFSSSVHAEGVKYHLLVTVFEGYTRLGDMILPDEIFNSSNIGSLNVEPRSQARWTNKRIPYVIDRSLSRAKNLILSAMEDYHSNTCLKFVPRTNERNYVKLFSGQGCYSYVGMINRGEQPLSLGQGCLYKGTVVHELGHAIGFFHEHNRSDRDEYLTIHYENIQQGMESQFVLLQPDENLLLTPFDYVSIMLYGNYAFSKDRSSMTIEAKNGMALSEPYDKEGLSESDIQEINEMYGC